MKEGKILKEFEVKNRQVVFRYPKLDDLQDFIKMQKTLLDEKAMCGRFNFNEQSGREHLTKILSDIRKNIYRYILVVVDNKLCGYGYTKKAEGSYTQDYTRDNTECSHIEGALAGYKYCVVGLALTFAVRGMGIGTRLMQLLEDESKELGAERLFLDVWSANKAAIHVYTKLGYREIGRRPGWVLLDSGEDADSVEMIKDI